MNTKIIFTLLAVISFNALSDEKINSSDKETTTIYFYNQTTGQKKEFPTKGIPMTYNIGREKVRNIQAEGWSIERVPLGATVNVAAKNNIYTFCNIEPFNSIVLATRATDGELICIEHAYGKLNKERTLSIGPRLKKLGIK